MVTAGAFRPKQSPSTDRAFKSGRFRWNLENPVDEDIVKAFPDAYAVRRQVWNIKCVGRQLELNCTRLGNSDMHTVSTVLVIAYMGFSLRASVR